MRFETLNVKHLRKADFGKPTQAPCRMGRFRKLTKDVKIPQSRAKLRKVTQSYTKLDSIVSSWQVTLCNLQPMLRNSAHALRNLVHALRNFALLCGILTSLVDLRNLPMRHGACFPPPLPREIGLRNSINFFLLISNPH